MTERIFHLTNSVAPELVHHRHLHRAARLYRPIKRSVGILDICVERDGGAAAALRRKTMRRKLAAEHQRRIADFYLSMHDRLAVGRHESIRLLCAKSFLVKVNRFGGV